MIVDTSAVLAVLFDEPDSELYDEGDNVRHTMPYIGVLL